MIYTQYLAKQLKEREEAIVELITQAVQIISNLEDSNEDNTIMESLTLEKFYGIMPMIMENEKGDLTGYNYWDPELDNDQEFLEKRKKIFLESGKDPIEGFGSSTFVYYEYSRLYRLISLFPVLQILLISTFVLLGYFIFTASRKAEQNRIWAGMAKETAHQLGTPTSAILGWIEHLKEISGGNPEHEEVIKELKNDVDRLDLIADRFSKIGSKPDLTKINMLEELHDCKEYMEKRAPKKVSFDFPEQNGDPIYCMINSHLFSWVIENLLRNALDAMEAEGKIECRVNTENQQLHIDIQDSGKGIPQNDFNKIFRPGFTTKKRGWGLGLSLAKRIIENYHKGKIFVKASKPNEGTTFTIILPLA